MSRSPNQTKNDYTSSSQLLYVPYGLFNL